MSFQHCKKSIFIRASHRGKCVIDVCGRKLKVACKVACVDGSQFGRFYGCVLQSVGEANLLLDIEPTDGKGKEIPTTRILLDRVFDEYGDGFVDIFLLDGLYADKKTINQVVSRKSHVLIKATETSLSIIQDADSLSLTTSSLREWNTQEALMLIDYANMKSGHVSCFCQSKSGSPANLVICCIICDRSISSYDLYYSFALLKC